jgi:outer membrane protein OmpA-like peptidoglycan-associated protein
MFATPFKRRVQKGEGESPFWISFADLMTALMTLFLVVMAVTLVSVQKSIPDVIAKEASRQKDIAIVMGLLKKESTPFAKVKVDAENFRLDLGDIVYFDSNSSTITSPVAAELRAYVPVLLAAKHSENGRWIKRFIVEGFTDQDGTFTHNLKLSTDRSRSVICSLVSTLPSTPRLSPEQLVEVQKYFSLGGFSSFSIREDKQLSRRVEIRIEFKTLSEMNQEMKNGESKVLLNRDFGVC